MRHGLEHDAGLLRQQHRAKMRERTEVRGRAIVEVLTRYHEQRDRAGALDPAKHEKKIAQLAAAERREVEAVYDRRALESFVAWSIRRRREIERDAVRLERVAERDDVRRTQCLEHEAQRLREAERALSRDEQQQNKSRGRG